jgi:hypothetical protein
MLTVWYLAILHHLGWAAGPSALPMVTALLSAVSKRGVICVCE